MEKSLKTVLHVKKKKYFCNPVLRVTRTARVKETAPPKGAGEWEDGDSSLNEWNDVANNSSNFFECLAITFRRSRDRQKRKRN